MTDDWIDQLQHSLGENPQDLEQLLAKMVDEITKAFEADRATFYLLDHSRRELVSRAAHLPEIREIRLRLGEGVAGWVGDHGEPLRMCEDAPDPRFASRIDQTTGYATKSMLCVPVRDSEDQIIGVLQVLNKHRGSFTVDDQDRLTTTATKVAKLVSATSLASQLRPHQNKPLSFRFNFIVGSSPQMHRVYERVERAAPTDATVLLRGETGTGKGLLARAIHVNSNRKNKPFVKVDCAALPSALIENELFGHVRGAFTGAVQDRPGKVDEAHQGTLFLDEIAELPYSVQGKLLRLLQDRAFVRVGGNQTQSADMRFICATHQDLEKLVEEGGFRRDLYYRIRVIDIDIPALKHRGHLDLDRLIDHFLHQFGKTHNRTDIQLAPQTRAALHAWSWPGNVRELEHCIESAVILSPDPIISPDHLPFRVPIEHRFEPTDGPTPFFVRCGSLGEVEQAYIRHVLEQLDGNKSAAARLLGIGRNTLNRKLTDG